MVEAMVVEADKKGQHEKKAFYGYLVNGRREITYPRERVRCQVQVWGT